MASDTDEAGAEDAAAIEAGRRLFAQACDFVIAAVEPGQLPDDGLPEVAFAGRSNVGKSSLVNALTGRKTLARTSNTPGRTQQLIFFNLGDRLMLVDLPGYGFASAPKQAVARWTGLTRDFLRGRSQLRRVCLLIDSRHGIKAGDREIMAAMDEAAVSYQAILTKSDKTKTAALDKVRTDVESELARHGAAHPEVMVTSSLKGQGISELRAALAALSEPDARH